MNFTHEKDVKPSQNTKNLVNLVGKSQPLLSALDILSSNRNGIISEIIVANPVLVLDAEVMMVIRQLMSGNEKLDAHLVANVTKVIIMLNIYIVQQYIRTQNSELRIIFIKPYSQTPLPLT